MIGFRILLIAMAAILLWYTGLVIAGHGWNYLATAQRDLLEMGWAGQFDADFLMMLTLSGLWVAWRHHFSMAGLGFGLLAFLGGVGFLSLYLLVLSFSTRGDVVEMLIGKSRAAARV
jgi:hypothetical protein